jgi:hypothetical protein
MAQRNRLGGSNLCSPKKVAGRREQSLWPRGNRMEGERAVAEERAVGGERKAMHDATWLVRQQGNGRENSARSRNLNIT